MSDKEFCFRACVSVDSLPHSFGSHCAFAGRTKRCKELSAYRKYMFSYEVYPMFTLHAPAKVRSYGMLLGELNVSRRDIHFS
jgi:hypothetical protein